MYLALNNIFIVMWYINILRSRKFPTKHQLKDIDDVYNSFFLQHILWRNAPFFTYFTISGTIYVF